MGTYQADDGWTALAEPTRRLILQRLVEKPSAVGELAEVMPISRPAVSQHLKVLKQAGLVDDRAAGTRRIYHANPAGMQALRDELESFWGKALATYAEVVAQESNDNPGEGS